MSTASLTYAYRWVFKNWRDVPTGAELTSDTFQADGVFW
jgi:hypothetical protein